jgi:spore coat polysaccharide biosynthesis protein SpsF (cytidylyltransferase family)
MVDTSRAELRVFVQARMNSARFPGKVLAPLAGRPLIAHVLERCAAACGNSAVVVLTSREPADDAIEAHARSAGFDVFRGDLENVALRFQQCLAARPAEWFVRISGDSPLIDPALVRAVAAARAPAYDLVTNVQVRTFPAGQSVEVVRARRFESIDTASLSSEEREHVTLTYYRHPSDYSILNLRSADETLARQRHVVDTPEDLVHVEQLMKAGAPLRLAEAIAGRVLA